MSRFGAIALCFLCAASLCLADSDLKAKWKEVTESSGSGEWGYGHLEERRGQICDPWRSFGDEKLEEDIHPGCTVVFIADPDDEYDVGTVADGEQNNFQNTQHYNAAWNLHGEGFLGDSLPRAPKDIHPVCYIANVSGTVVLGYEEGNGGELLPCPGALRSVPFTEEQILAEDADLEDMCSQCYHSVCSGVSSRNARNCGNEGTGGVNLENEAEFMEQTGPAYHCHLTMADHGACDYVQYDQHESSRTYYMDYTVLCGWDKIKYLNITHCDCTREAGTANGCRSEEALKMALAGVICGNCNGGFNQDRALEYIFAPLDEESTDSRRFNGMCAAASTAESELGRQYSMMMCSKGLFCPNGFNGGEGCRFHCDKFGIHSDVFVDEECGDYVAEGGRRLLSAAEWEHHDPLSLPQDKLPITLDTRFDRGHVFESVRATGYTPSTAL